MMFHTLKNRTKGFTLIELLVVIAIIGILSSVVLASLSTARQKSRDAKRISDLGQVQLALELYFDSRQSYPIQATAAATGLGTAAMIAAINTAPSNSFIPQIPITPAGATAYGYMGLSSPAVECQTALPCTVATSYAIFAELERGDNTTLLSDADQVTTGTVFNGTSITCNGTAGTPQGQATPTERCYDIKP